MITWEALRTGQRRAERRGTVRLRSLRPHEVRDSPDKASGGNANMVRLDVFLALLSGISNGLFTAPMKVIPRWKWRRLPERPAPLAPYSKP